MSHYSVAVFTHSKSPSLEELLEPYDENIEVEPYISHSKDSPDYLENKKFWDKEMIDDDGNLLSTYNPDSKWDWYMVGGRFSNHIKLKNGKYADSAKVKDIDFSSDSEVYNKALRFWEIAVEDAPLMDGEEKPFIFYKKEYYLERYKDKEDYAKKLSSWTTYAVLTPDGIWHEPGQMGWWGISTASSNDEIDWDENYYERFIKAADPEWELTIVDCHI